MLRRLRNVGILAHVDGGKTTLTERMLYLAGVVRRMGNVDRGDTVTDYLAQERERGITITSAATRFAWRDHGVNLIDTPGHVDFSVEVERSLRVLDGVVLVVDAVAGVQAQTSSVWRRVDAHGLPAVVYVNKMDRSGADLGVAIESVRAKLGVDPLALQIPDRGGGPGLVDLVAMTRVEQGDGGMLTAPLAPGEFDAQREALVERVAEVDEPVLERFLDAGPMAVGNDELRAGIRRATLARSVVPVLCGSALRNRFVEPLMDGIVDYLPSPHDAGIEDGAGANSEFTRALAFKVRVDKQRGPVVFVKVYDGVLRAGMLLANLGQQGKGEKATRLVRMHAESVQEVEQLSAGDIGAILGNKAVRTGDTLVWAPGGRKATSQIEPLAGVRVPEPVFFRAVEADSPSDEGPLLDALRVIAQEDPSIRHWTDAESGQLLVGGLGELHLEIVEDRLARDFGVNATMGKVRVQYRETPTVAATARREISRVNKRGEREESWCEVRVDPADSEAEAEDNISVSPAVWEQLRRYNKVARAAIKAALERGPNLLLPVARCRATIVDAGGLDNTSDACIAMAVDAAVQAALRDAACTLLEPVMLCQIEAPESSVGAVLSDLGGARRAQIQAVVGARGGEGGKEVHAIVPVAQLVGYASDLRSMTQGKATLAVGEVGWARMAEDDANRVVVEMGGWGG